MFNPRLSPPQNKSELIYTTIEFDSKPSQQIHGNSQPRSDYIPVDITATNALYKTVKQTELDNERHAKELAGKKKPYENSGMIVAHKNKMDLEHSFDDLKIRKTSDGLSPVQSPPDNNKRLFSDMSFKSDKTSVGNRRFSDEPPTLLDYENVSFLKGNYENVSFNPFEQEKHI